MVTFYDKTDVNTLINGCFPVGLGYTLSAEIATLSGNIGTMSSNISTNYTTLSALITSVSGFVATNRTNISTLSGNITTMSSTISTDYATLSGLITSISGTLTSLSGKIQIIDYPATVPATSVSIAAITTAPNVVTLYNLEAGPTGYVQVAYDTKYAGQVIAIDVSPACASILGTAVSQGMLQEYVNLNTNNTLAGLNTFTGAAIFNNSVNINSGTINFEVCNQSYYGNIHCIPNIDTHESAIGFYRHANKSLSASGDCWFIGNNLYNNTPSCFSIGCYPLGPCLTIDPAGNTTLPNILYANNSIEMFPTISGQQAAISFYKNNDRSVNATGDAWAVGYNVGNSSGSVFSIGASGLGNIITIDDTGTTTISANVNINGTLANSQITTLNTNLNNLTTTVNSLETSLTTVSQTQYFAYTLYDPGVTTNYRIGTLHLPQNGHQARIRVNLCAGYNISTTGGCSDSWRIQNYELNIYIYSSNGNLLNGAYVGSARGFDAGTAGETSSASYAIGLYYSGYVTATTPHTTPLNCYIGFVPTNPLGSLDIWMESYAWHGVPLIEVSQTDGSFDKTTATKAVNIPQTG